MMYVYIRLMVQLLCVFSILFPPNAEAAPNFVILMADDLGMGDLGCFGNSTLRTPNLDRLAREGMKLTQHLSASSICTPSRTAFLTGRYPIRSGMAPQGDMSVMTFVASPAGLPENETTFAEMSKKAGYSTCLIGKWHLGLNCERLGDNCHNPLNQGFDYFYGIPLTNLKDFGGDGDVVLLRHDPYFREKVLAAVALLIIANVYFYRRGIIGHVVFFILILLVILSTTFTMRYLIDFTTINSVLVRDNDIVEQPIRLETLTKRFVQEGEFFLEQRANDGNPFLLFLSWSHVHTYLKSAEEFSGKSNHGKYGDAVEELDWGIGQILSTLDRFRLTNDTMVYFTSDNGGHLEESDIFGNREGGDNGIYRGGKTHGAPDGGIRVPTIVRWPHVIPAGTSSDEPTSLMDIFPTIANIIGVPLPTDRITDGIDILPLLTKKLDRSPHEYLFHYFGTTVHAARYRPREGAAIFKLVLARPNYLPGQERCSFVCTCNDIIILESPELYNLAEDPEEKQPLDFETNVQYKTVVDEIMKALRAHADGVDIVPSQFEFFHLLWRPWLQPCCNFPYCDCVDTKYS